MKTEKYAITKALLNELHTFTGFDESPILRRQNKTKKKNTFNDFHIGMIFLNHKKLHRAKKKTNISMGPKSNGFYCMRKNVACNRCILKIRDKGRLK